MRSKRTGKNALPALLCSLLLVFSSLPLTANADSADSTVVWSLDTSKMGVPGTVADGEYLQGTDGLYQPGIQIADKGNSSMQMYEGGVLGILPSNGSYKAINIQTGTAVGGTNYYTNNGFMAEADKEYTVTFNVYAAFGTGEVRVRGNQQTAANADWVATSIGATPVAVSYTWTQSATGGNLQIDTGSTAQGTIVYITDLQITTTSDTSTPTPPKPVVAYDLQQDTGLADLVSGGGNAYLQKAGPLTLNAVSGADGKVSLDLSNRTDSWHGVDVKAAAIGLKADTAYTVEMTGHIPDDVTIPGGAKIVLGGAGDPWATLASVDATPAFTLSYSGTAAADTGETTGLRFQADPGLARFVIDTLVVTVTGGTAMPPKPMSNVPGVHVSLTSNGDSWSGANIILGTDSSVWPYATGDAVAFTPVQDAEYRLKFNATSTGTSGYRVRWITGNDNGGYTSADAAVVSDAAHTYAAGQVATTVPGSFTSGVNKAEALDFVVDFVMSGSEPVQGLIGNLAIRGVAGSNDFLLNSLEITDEDGNVLVNWTGSSTPFVPDDYVWPEAKWNVALPSLKDAYRQYFRIGNIMEPAQTTDATLTAMYNKQYNAVTAENAMKPESLLRGMTSASELADPGKYNFAGSDQIVKWAEDHRQAIHGHTLVWHSQTPAFINTGASGTRAAAQANMKTFIDTVIQHFDSPNLISWDVVNEAFDDNTAKFDGSDWRTGLRTGSPWYIAYANGADASQSEHGADYIYDAFVFTHLAQAEIGSKATLYYNDYNETYKYEQIAQMVEDLNAQWENDPRYDGRKLIEGIGMQSHFWINSKPDVNAQEVERAIRRFVETGARLSISELDIPYSANNNYHLDEEKQAYQAEQYGTLFGLYKKYAASIDRVTFWGKADVQSWRGSGMPLLFDNSFRAKAAFWKVIGLGSPASTDDSDDSGTPPAAQEPAAPGEVNAEVDTNGHAQAEFTAEDVKKALSEVKAGTMKLQVQGAENAQQVTVSLSGDQVNAAKEAGIQRIEIASGLASVQLSVSLLEGAADNASIELNVAKVDNRTLSDAQRAWVGSNAVFEFDLSVDGKKITDFGQDQPVKVAIPYTLKPGEHPGQIVIYYLSDDGKLEVIKNGRYNEVTSSVEFHAKHFSLYAAVANPVTFNDSKAVAWASESIDGLAARGIVSGMTKETFAPSRSVTRSEFIQMLMLTLDLNDANATSTFSDAKPGAWYYDAVASAQRLGIASGIPDGSFGIHDNITRQEMAAMAYRGIQKAGITLHAEQSATIRDAQDIVSYAKEAVTALHQAGILDDDGNGNFHPTGTASRAEAAVMLYRLLMKSL